MLKIQWAQQNTNPYTSKNGNTTFVYHVEGTKEELAAYKASKGEFYREDAKAGNKPLFFTIKAVGNSAELAENSKGEFEPNMRNEQTPGSPTAQPGTETAREKPAATDLDAAEEAAEPATPAARKK